MRRETIGKAFGSSAAAIAVGSLAILALMFIALMFTLGFGIFQRETADFRGDVEVREQTQADGSFRIGAYNHFFDLCASIQAEESRIASLRRELETDPRESRQEQINASLAAIESSRERKIQQYNVDAAKDYTVGQFRDSGLPHQIDSRQENTTCVMQ